ncbi:MAG TPA: hypothetical protein VFC65_18465 [Prolixibacteraceae bacterium]|nr:hypothetical protein [Prolixibacteraceae bacterium]
MRFRLLFLITFLTANVYAQNSSSDNKITVFTIGDSTMANKKASVAPETGWCQALPSFVDPTVEIKNRAVNGRSSKSFISEGRWKAIGFT